MSKGKFALILAVITAIFALPAAYFFSSWAREAATRDMTTAYIIFYGSATLYPMPALAAALRWVAST